VRQVSSSIAPTTDHVVVTVVDPTRVTGHTYAVTYAGGDARVRRPHGVASDTPWSLVDLTTGQTLLADELERSDTPSYPPVDGMVVTLREQQSDGDPLNDIFYTPFRADPPFHGVLGAALTTFGDGFGYANDFYGGVDYTAQPELFPNVELRFGASQKAYRYFRDEKPVTGGSLDGNRGWMYGGFHDVPVQAWDVDRGVQLEIGFVERRITDGNHVPTGAQPPSQDGTWMPDGSGDGGREYLSISARPYTGSAESALAQDGAMIHDSDADGNFMMPLDTLWLYAAWLQRTGTPVAGDRFVIEVGGNVVGTANDSLVFTTRAPLAGQVALQRGALDRIRVVPNPYYGRSTYELSSVEHVVRFTNMPETAVVRIYDLAGDLVRTLRKSDPASSILQWDLLTDNHLPLASGVYVYRVEAPGAGVATGKMAIFMSKEQLTNY
jgi:hypothetical protein